MERRKNAFTLIELLVVIAIIALLIGILLPALGQAKRSALNIVSLNNQKSLNTGAANYAADNSDRIFSYTWRANVTYTIAGVGTKTGTTDAQAAGFQNMEILVRSTGRAKGGNRFLTFRGRLPHRRYSHLVLLDFLTDVLPEPIAASPFDKNLIEWQENPLIYREGASSGLPYATDDIQAGYEVDTDGNWAVPTTLQRWPFASSYQVVPAAWTGDGIGGENVYVPQERSPHLFGWARDDGNPDEAPKVGRRRFTQVAHPSGKVHMFEEFDRFSDKDGLYFAYPDAKPNLSFFDGSVRSESTADANPGWNPTPALRGTEWRQTYVPLDTFPIPRDGLENNTTQYCQRFRWTRHGLQGVDFGGSDVGRNQYGLEREPVGGCIVDGS